VYEFGVPTCLLPSIFQGAAYPHQQHDRQMAAALRTARLASGGVVNATFPILSIISTFSHFRAFTEMY
jgi:hypothetical protein